MFIEKSKVFLYVGIMVITMLPRHPINYQWMLRSKLKIYWKYMTVSFVLSSVYFNRNMRKHFYFHSFHSSLSYLPSNRRCSHSKIRFNSNIIQFCLCSQTNILTSSFFITKNEISIKHTSFYWFSFKWWAMDSQVFQYSTCPINILLVLSIFYFSYQYSTCPINILLVLSFWQVVLDIRQVVAIANFLFSP